MRRFLDPSKPCLLRDTSPPQERQRRPDVWTASFELRSITPVLGGGVLSFEPDTVDIVRVPTIRGHLRWWWRALYQRWDEAAGPAVDALFAQEARLWGGVGLPGAEGTDERQTPGLRSRVRLTAEVLERGETVRAGVHRLGDDGHLKTPPRWEIGGKLKYALFPLQQSSAAREEFERLEPGRDMPTRLVRKDVRFRLDVAVVGPRPGLSPALADVFQVLASLWGWLHFGGLGARTRRGFGALEIAGAIRIDEVPGLDVEAWQRLLAGPREGTGQPEAEVLSWLRDLEQAASPRGRGWPLEILVGRRTSKAAMAHQEVVDLLRTFRQEPGTGRDPGTSRPGPSRWPEPNLLRALAPSGPSFGRHEPPPDIVQQAGAGQVGAPRAAFGLPIQVQFKDGMDRRASAMIVPPGAQRWSSPLLLRPLRTADGGYYPSAVLLPVPAPEQVEIEYEVEKKAYPSGKKTKKRVDVARSAGARSTIDRFLTPAAGRALEAFARWLAAEKGYRRVTLRPNGGRDA